MPASIRLTPRSNQQATTVLEPTHGCGAECSHERHDEKGPEMPRKKVHRFGLANFALGRSEQLFDIQNPPKLHSADYRTTSLEILCSDQILRVGYDELMSFCTRGNQVHELHVVPFCLSPLLARKVLETFPWIAWILGITRKQNRRNPKGDGRKGTGQKIKYHKLS